MMNRRSFLKCVAALSGAIALPASASQAIDALVDAAIADNVAWPAGILREIAAYDIARDEFLLRYDVCTGTNGKLSASGDVQLQAVYRWGTADEWKDKLDEQRKIARVILKTALEKHGKSLADCRKMELPLGCYHSANI